MRMYDVDSRDFDLFFAPRSRLGGVDRGGHRGGHRGRSELPSDYVILFRLTCGCIHALCSPSSLGHPLRHHNQTSSTYDQKLK